MIYIYRVNPSPRAGNLISSISVVVVAESRQLGLYKIFFYFESFVHESIVLSFLPPTCIGHTVAILFATLGQHTTPPRPPLCMPHTIQYR